MTYLIIFRSWETDEPNSWQSATSDVWDGLWKPYYNWGKKKIDTLQIQKFEMVAYNISEEGGMSWKDNVVLVAQTRRQINA